jgi:Xaa-Pro aminopeptidase
MTAGEVFSGPLSSEGVHVRETGEKVERLQRIAHDNQLAGVLLGAQYNFAWLTGGGLNRVDGSREAGVAALLVAADGRRFVLANSIEMPRMLDEELKGFDFEPVEFPWASERADPAFVTNQAKRVLGTSPAVGSDLPLAGTVNVDAVISRARAPLTPEEAERYRALGRETGVVVGDVCRTLAPGQAEREIARRVADAIASLGARAIVTLVAADDRIGRYRHPVPTLAKWQNAVLVAACAERGGLIVSLTRMIAARADNELARRTRATADVFARMLTATRPDATGRDIFAATVRGYEEVGFPGEELKHHQGGATGYRSREWVAHPSSGEIVRERQAFAWNPTITGTKVEDTVLVDGNSVEALSSTPDWPSIALDAGGREVRASDVLVIG